MIKLHRIIAEAFCEKPEHLKDIPFEDLEVDHINTIRDDNRAENLKWCTRIENQNNSLTKKHNSDAKKGDKAPWFGKHFSDEHRRKMSEARIGKHHSEETKKKISNTKEKKVLYQCTLDGKVVKVWESRQEAVRNGYNKGCIHHCISGKYKTYKGFIWKYA